MGVDDVDEPLVGPEVCSDQAEVISIWESDEAFTIDVVQYKKS